jgi:GrpB-like predicted nucleotidyltransferase (UPF0157 family)/quercetin dioxygenase-like cupin family protein
MNLDNLTAEQIGKLFPIRIVPYNADWKLFFNQEKVLITEVLGEEIALNIEHFGSTSVVGLAAKPTIDILVEVPNLSYELKQVITQKLGTIGYENMYNAEKDNKMTFGKGYDNINGNSQTYHVHIRQKSNQLQDEIYFRDYLRQNPDICDEYAKLKYALAEKHQFNREDYTQAKSEFIIKITERQKKENMKKIEIISESENHTAVNVGNLNELQDYSFIHPKNGQIVTGKVFLKQPTHSTGTEISFSTIPPNKDLGYFHIHNKDEETYIILKGSGFYQVDNDCFPIKQGSVIRVAPEGVRSLCNNSDEEMIYICIQSRVNSLEEYSTNDGKRVEGNAKWE